MVWGLIGLVAVLGALWLWDRRGAASTLRVRLQPDPFADRRSMVRYHEALRPKGRPRSPWWS